MAPVRGARRDLPSSSSEEEEGAGGGGGGRGGDPTTTRSLPRETPEEPSPAFRAAGRGSSLAQLRSRRLSLDERDPRSWTTPSFPSAQDSPPQQAASCSSGPRLRRRGGPVREGGCRGLPATRARRGRARQEAPCHRLLALSSFPGAFQGLKRNFHSSSRPDLTQLFFGFKRQFFLPERRGRGGSPPPPNLQQFHSYPPFISKMFPESSQILLHIDANQTPISWTSVRL